MHPPGYLVVEELLGAEGWWLAGGGPLAMDGEDGGVEDGLKNDLTRTLFDALLIALPLFS